MIRSFTSSAFAVAFAAVSAHATDLSFSGSVDAGYMADLNTLENTPKSLYNLEANLGVDAKISDVVSVQLFATSLAGAVPGAFVPGKDSTGYVGRWPAFAFDGASVTWKLGEDKTLVVGDIVVAKGGIAYYVAKRYSTVTRVSAVRGASFTAGGLNVFGGADDDADSLFTVGGSYLLGIDSLNSVEPAAIVHFGGKDDLSWGGGLQYKGKFGAAALSASASVFGGKNEAGDDAIGYALAVEPSFATDAFYVSAFGFFSPSGDDNTHSVFTYPVRHGRTYAAWEEDLTLYVEPGVNLPGGKAAIGLPVEYHEANLDTDDDERISLVPSFYLYPAKDVTITTWGQVDFWSESGKDATFSAGLETVFKF